MKSSKRKICALLRRGAGLLLVLSQMAAMCPWAYAAPPEKETIPPTAAVTQELPELEPPADQPHVLTATEVTYPVTGGLLYFDTATGTITDCDSTVTSAEIPAEIQGVSVTVIGNEAFFYCRSLAIVTIPDSVTVIGNSAFSNCIGLTSMTIPDSVTFIGDGAFQYCTSLSSVSIPDSVTSIENSAFYWCRSLTSVTIPDSVTVIRDSAFYGCESLTSVSIPDSVTVIDDSAFYGCESLTSVTIPNSVTVIGNSAFSYCASLTSVTLPGSLTTMGEYAFAYCDNLISVTIPSSVTVIEDCAFARCESLASVTIENGITAIGNYAFSNCSNLTSVSIPDTVTSIGMYAFYQCSNLTSVILPHSLTTLGEYAFSHCSNLISVTIPGSVTAIRECTFSWCYKLTSVTIPDSVITIENEAFHGCSSLASVTIPDSVTTIGDEAFAVCYSLTSVTLSNSVTTIGDLAFYYCNSLTSVTIPNSVTAIGDSVFSWCLNLTSVLIPNSVTAIGKDVFSRCDNMTLYCESGSYAHQYAIDNSIRFVLGSPDYGESEGTYIPIDKYLISVVDPNGTPLPGVLVDYASQSGETSSDGTILFDRVSWEQAVITATKTGYITWSKQDITRPQFIDFETTIILYPTAYKDLMLQTASYKSGISETDLLTHTKQVNLKSTSTGDLSSEAFSITCSALKPSSVKEYQLWQDDTLIAKSSDGQFSFHTASGFTAGGGCFIRAIGTELTADTNLNLTFIEDAVPTVSDFSLIDNIVNVTDVSEDIPFLGGLSFELGGIGKLPLEVTVTTEKLYIGFNTDLLPEEDASDSEKEDKYAQLKASICTIIGDKNKKLSARALDVIKELKKQPFNFALPGGSVELSVIGYAEADWGSSTATGSIYLLFNAETPTLGFTTWVVVVPVTVYVSGSLELKAECKISYHWDSQTLIGEIPVDLTLGLDAFGGVGVGKAVGVGAYGAGKAEFGLQFLSDPFLQKLDLTGELGIKAYVGGLEKKKAFPPKTWHIVPSNTTSAYALEATAEAAYGLYRSDNYVPQNLDYLSEESHWLGNGVSLYSASASTVLTPLLTDTYRNAQPTMISTGDGLYAVFLRADSATGEIYAAATKYNGTTWAEPVRLKSDAVLDGTPQLLAADDGTVWVTYAQTNADADASSLLNWAKGQTIVVGTLDPDTLSFTETASYTGAGYVHDQTLTMANGVPTLVWMESAVTSDDDVLSSASNTIHYATWNGSAWSEAVELTTIEHPIWQIAAGETGIVCNIDQDGNLATTDDAVLTLYGYSGSVEELATGVTGHVTYGMLPGETAPSFLWNGDHCLITSNGTTVPAPGITREYAVTDDRIYYSAAGETGAHLTTVMFDGTSWSTAVTLTGGERYLENLSVVTFGGNDYLLGMNTQATISAENVEDAKNLVWATVMPSSDLRLDDITYSADGLAPGDAVPVTLYVTNAGDHTVESLTIECDGTRQMVACSIAPGETLETGWELTCSDTLTSHSFSVYETEMDDFTPEDNTTAVSIGYADLAVELVEKKIGSYHALEAVITNNGVSPASGRLQLIDENGSVFALHSFDAVAPGEVVVVTCTLDVIKGDYTASLLCQEEDLYSHNNTSTIYVVNTGAYLDVTEAGQNLTVNLNAVESGTVYCAVYDEYDQLLDVQTQTVSAGEQTVSFACNNSDFTQWKVFLLNDKFVPQCASVQRKNT